jgi:redox-sensitive bicupin YhaK (pirin superfamily)
MIQTTPSSARHHGDFGWLQAHWHFSFGDYHDPKNLHWSALRVFNDDTIQPGGTFESHPHRDMEIVSYVVDGTLEHRDNNGGHGIVHPGEIQVMSAGSGIVHSERNPSETEAARLCQIWIFPRTKGAKPRWAQKQFSPQERRGRLLPIVSDGSIAGTLPIDQDAVIYVSQLAPGETVIHRGDPSRAAYLFVISGAVTLNGSPLAAADQARISGEASLEIRATEDAHVILLDLP